MQVLDRGAFRDVAGESEIIATSPSFSNVDLRNTGVNSY